MRRTRQGRPEALVSRATLFASFPVVNILKQSTAFSVTDMSTCTTKTNRVLAHHQPAFANTGQVVDTPQMAQAPEDDPDEVEAGNVSTAKVPSNFMDWKGGGHLRKGDGEISSRGAKIVGKGRQGPRDMGAAYLRAQQLDQQWNSPGLTDSCLVGLVIHRQGPQRICCCCGHSVKRHGLQQLHQGRNAILLPA